MKILIIRLSSIGDIVLTEPVIRHLRKVYPGCRIDYLTKQPFVPLVKLFEGVDTVIPFIDKTQAVRAVKEHLSSVSGKEKSEYDLLIDLHAKPKTFLLKIFLPAQRKVSYNKQHLRRFLITAKISKSSIDSTVFLYFSIFSHLNIDIERSDYQPQLKIKLQDSSLNKLWQQEKELKTAKTIALFPGANHKTKRYPVGMLAAFINSIPENENYRFVLLGSEEEKAIAERLRNLCRIKPLNWCGRFNLGQLAEIVSYFDVIITNDSGPMHIAAALKKKQIAIFGATHPRLGFAPLNENALILQTDLPCRPCSLHGGENCPKKHFRCLKEISPEKLKEALLSFS
jgi:lipopolysaccharide heptosyltransferase II